MPEAGELYLLPKRENNWHLNNVVNEFASRSPGVAR